MADKVCIRIDKQDGTEEVVPRSFVSHVIANSFNRPDEVEQIFDEGRRIHSPFAYYELRDAKEARA